MAEDTWETLAVPVLEAIALAEDEGTNLLQVEAIAGHELDARRVSVELKRLSQGGYVGGKIDGTFAGPESDFIINPYLLERGARAVGRWPSSDPYQALLQHLERAEERAEDPAQKAAIKKVLGTVGEVGQGVLTGVLGAYVRAVAGLP